MKAVSVRNPAEILKVVDRPIPEPGAGKCASVGSLRHLATAMRW